MNLIKKIENLLSSDTSRDSFFSIFGQGAAALAGFAFFAICARSMSLEEFGYFSLALATASIVKDVIDPALNATLVKFISQGEESAKHVTRYVIQIKMLYFGLILGIGFLFSEPLSKLIFKNSLQLLLLMTAVTSAVLSAGSMISGFLQGYKRFKEDAFFVFLQPMIRLAFVGVALYFGHVGVVEFLVVNSLAYLVAIGLFASVITFEYISGDIPKSAKVSANVFIGPLTISTVTGTLIDRIGLFLTNYLLGPAQVGLLAAVLRLFIPAQQIAGVLNSVFGSRFASFTKSTQADDYLKKSLALIAPITLTALAAIPLAPYILGVFGSEYIAGTPLLRIITFGFIAFLFQVPFVAKMIYFKNRTDLMVYISLFQLAVTVIFEWIFITWLGLSGAAVAISMTMITIAITYMVCSTKISKRKIGK